MKILSQISAWVVFGVILLLSVSFWIWTPYSGNFDKSAVKQIHRLCGVRPDCDVRLGDLSSRKFDTYYEFRYDVPNTAVQAMLGSSRSKNHGLQRDIVLTKEGHVVFREYADMGARSPLANEIVLRCPTSEDGWIKCSSDDLFRVSAHASREGFRSPFHFAAVWYDLKPVGASPLEQPGY